MERRIMISAVTLLAIGFLSIWSLTAFAGDDDLFLPVVRNDSLTPGSGPTTTATPTTTPSPPPSWPAIALTPVADDLASPIYVTHAGDGSGRLFVVEREGMIRILQDGQPLDEPFLDIRGRVECCSSELGLFSMAFSPTYAENREFYVSYTAAAQGRIVSRISRFRTTADDNIADPDSEQIVLSYNQVEANHNGGQIAFGPDGFLYISTGDGGGSGDPQENGQDLTTLLGKILRIDVEDDSSSTYTIPADNPFVDHPDAREHIWAYGLRNPWRFSFDRQTGDLYIGDVGQGKWEEIDFQPAGSSGGENYGWNIMEGPECFAAATCQKDGLTLPVAYYGRDLGRSITGGFVYRGQDFPDLEGIYFYADYITGRIWGLRRHGDEWQSHEFLDSPYNVASFGEDEAGELYVVDLSGTLHRIVLEE